MKKIVAIGIMLVTGICSAQEYQYKPMSMNITTNSRLLLAPTIPAIPTYSAFIISNAYTNVDQIITYSNNFYQITVTGLSSTVTGPAHTEGDATNGATTMRFINKYRNLAYFINDSTNKVYLSTGTNAIFGSGILLNPNGGVYTHTGKGPVYGISNTLTNNITIQEQ